MQRIGELEENNAGNFERSQVKVNKSAASLAAQRLSHEKSGTSRRTILRPEFMRKYKVSLLSLY